MTKIEAMAREAGIKFTPAGPADEGIDTWYGAQYLPSGALARFHALALEQAAVICDKRAQHFAGLIEQQSCAQCLAFDIRAAKEKP